MIFSAGPARVSCDSSGWVTSVVHEAAPGLSYLTGAALGLLRVNGGALPPPTPEVRADQDEVELIYTYPDLLRVVVRHTFAAGWGVRLAFSSLAATAQQVQDAELRLEPDPGCVAWALTLGVTGAYALSPATGTGPLLGGLLRLGSVDRATDTGLQLSPFELRPDGRYVVQLQWSWYASPRAFGQERYPEAPSALTVITGETIGVQVDEDVAVVVPDGPEVTEAPDHLEVTAEASGVHPFELRSARGTTRFQLQWVEPVAEVLTALVPRALSQPRTAAGVVKLAGVADALVVQHALAVSVVDDADEAAEALDLFTARRETSTPVVPLEAVYLCREFDRLGDVDLLAPALRAVLTATEPRPGLGIAATQLCLGLMVSGQGVEQVLGHLLRLAAGLADQDGAEGPVAGQAAALELIAVTYAGPGVAGSVAGPRGVAARIAALGLHLGAGLVGRPVSPLPVGELSHLITVLQLLPDRLGAELTAQWGCPANELARRATPELLSRLDGEPISEAHAWLVLAQQTS